MRRFVRFEDEEGAAKAQVHVSAVGVGSTPQNIVCDKYTKKSSAAVEDTEEMENDTHGYTDRCLCGWSGSDGAGDLVSREGSAEGS